MGAVTAKAGDRIVKHGCSSAAVTRSGVSGPEDSAMTTQLLAPPEYVHLGHLADRLGPVPDVTVTMVGATGWLRARRGTARVLVEVVDHGPGGWRFRWGTGRNSEAPVSEVPTVARLVLALLAERAR
jgi:hypothetical protein